MDALPFPASPERSGNGGLPPLFDLRVPPDPTGFGSVAGGQGAGE